MVAELAETGGDSIRAGRLFALAGRRSFDDGSTGSAANLLERANTLLSTDPDIGYRADVLGSVLLALSATGRFEHIAAHAATVDELADRNLDSRKVAALHVQLANAETMAGRWSAALAHVATARSLLGSDAGDADLAPVDCDRGEPRAGPARVPGRLKAATELATRAAEAAERGGAARRGLRSPATAGDPGPRARPRPVDRLLPSRPAAGRGPRHDRTSGSARTSSRPAPSASRTAASSNWSGPGSRRCGSAPSR